MIAIFAALNEEVDSLKREMSITRTSIHQDCLLYEGLLLQQACLLVLTGVGRRRAQRASEMVLYKYPIDAMISTGFSGALNDKTSVGDIVVYSKLCHGGDDGSIPPLNGILEPDATLMSISMKTVKETGLRVLNGTGVSIESVCATPEAKAALGKEFRADSVDMESYWLACAARERQVPFITIRSVFDVLKDDLSCLSQISSDGKIKTGAALVHLATHPGQVKKMTYLARNAKKAGKKIAAFLPRIVEAI